jgi:hypothetical protein
MLLPTFHPHCCRGAVAFAAIGMAALLGCAPSESIRSYDVKREKGEDSPGGPDRVRLLGAIIPVDAENSWFVKFTGPIDEISPHEKAFDEFVASIRVPGGNAPPTYTAPSGWKEGGKRMMRVATFTPPGEWKPPARPPELYISEKFQGTLLANVNRWRDEVGVSRVTEAEVPKVTTEVMLGSSKAYKVDYRGPGGKKKMGPFAGGM